MKGACGNMLKKLPVGVDGFEKIRTQGFYYVDKTMFISELLELSLIHIWIRRELRGSLDLRLD